MLFTAAARFRLTRGDGRIRVYRRRNERYTVLWRGIDLEVEGLSWSGVVCYSIIGLSRLSLQAISTLCVTWKTSTSLLVVPFLQPRPDMTLQYDNATSHIAHSVRDFLQDRNVLP